ncbi:hypothetical protein [Miniphocaeibacter massiliensis]|uniref:hypothetical protein n=1 Tax=Miniphocaeibacter massiliensis TaxID=2041841 RepID=UPI000C1C80C9|nr:hypothetical protein [Miniphocaeibacter massiliensis]
MFVSDLRKWDLEEIEKYKGSKTIKELTEIFQIENKSTENLRKVLDKNGIKYKFERKQYANKRIVKSLLQEVKQSEGVKLVVGKIYKFKDNTPQQELEFCFYEGKIVKEYKRFYLGVTKAGYNFTIHKYPNCYEIKEI